MLAAGIFGILLTLAAQQMPVGGNFLAADAKEKKVEVSAVMRPVPPQPEPEPAASLSRTQSKLLPARRCRWQQFLEGGHTRGAGGTGAVYAVGAASAPRVNGVVPPWPLGVFRAPTPAVLRVHDSCVAATVAGGGCRRLSAGPCGGIQAARYGTHAPRPLIFPSALSSIVPHARARARSLSPPVVSAQCPNLRGNRTTGWQRKPRQR